ncbi:hypothetical protein SNEBB_008801 [Seison nebaliae]|nr:hypothetical protein SNEBB_008801 [Seison nebaliae]
MNFFESIFGFPPVIPESPIDYSKLDKGNKWFDENKSMGKELYSDKEDNIDFSTLFNLILNIGVLIVLVNRTCKYVFGFWITSKPAHLLKNWIFVILLTMFEYFVKSFHFHTRFYFLFKLSYCVLFLYGGMDFTFDVIELIIKSIKCNGENLKKNTRYFSDETLTTNLTEKPYRLKESTEFNFTDRFDDSDDRFSFRSYPRSTTNQVFSEESMTKNAINFSKFFPENNLNDESSDESMKTDEEYFVDETDKEKNLKRFIMSKIVKRKNSKKLLEMLKKPKSLMSRLSGKIKVNEKWKSSREPTPFTPIETVTEQVYHPRQLTTLDTSLYRSTAARKILSITEISNIIHRRSRLSKFLRRCRL